MSAINALKALVGVVLLGSAGAAQAAERDPFAGAAPTSIRVQSAKLATPGQAKALAIRIRAAAATVCGGDVDPAVRTSDLFARCREAAIDRAVRGINDPQLARALGRTPAQLASVPR